MSQFIAPTGYVELDNDCEFSIDRKSTRSREEVNPKEDLAFYFNTYIIPKYGLNNINVSNVASFMKDLEMNWTKLSPESRNQTMNIMVDGILNKNSEFKTDLLAKLGIPMVQGQALSQPSVSTFGKSSLSSVSKFGKSSFGSSQNKVLIVIAIAAVVIFFMCKNKKRVTMYGRLS
jgi:hypothetical protein